jgi:acetyl-CoA/propionyl-CoA carboxylase biotin carboxyl carrier protein
VIEEAPSPFPTGSTRELLGIAAVRIARSVDYVGVGTVEFLVSGADPRDWYFLEMNTRLQVEHPVTEAVTGVDLVEAQLRVAAGEPLWLRTEVPERGHAVEARVYAERPARGFLPSTGRLIEVIEPTGVRVDSGVAAGQTVSADHDPMLLKVVAFADSRVDALRMLDAALGRTVLLGVHTNIAYLRQVLATPEVRDAAADTAFLDSFPPEPEVAPDDDVLAAAAFALWHAAADDGASPWAVRSGWRVGERARSSVQLLVDDEPVRVEIPHAVPPGLRAAVDGDVAWVWRDGTSWALRRLSRDETVARSRRDRRGAGLGGTADPQLRSPMPGTVVALPSDDGGDVEAGAVVAVVEAMKMEHAVLTPAGGRLELMVREGQTIVADQVVAVLHPAG